MENEIYRQAFGALIKDSDAADFDNQGVTLHLKGSYRILIDGNFEIEFTADSDEEAIEFFKDYGRKR